MIINGTKVADLFVLNTYMHKAIRKIIQKSLKQHRTLNVDTPFAIQHRSNLENSTVKHHWKFIIETTLYISKLNQRWKFTVESTLKIHCWISIENSSLNQRWKFIVESIFIGDVESTDFQCWKSPLVLCWFNSSCLLEWFLQFYKPQIQGYFQVFFA